MAKKRNKRKSSTRQYHKSRNKNSFSIRNVLSKRIVFIPVILIIGALAIANLGGFSFSTFGAGNWDFNVDYDYATSGSHSLTINKEFKIQEDNAIIEAPNLNTIIGGSSYYRTTTGFSTVGIGIGSWRSIYTVDGNDYISNIGESYQYAERFESGNVIRTYLLLMEINVRTYLQIDAVSPASTTSLDIESALTAGVPAINRQHISVEFSTAGVKTAYTSNDTASAFAILNVERGEYYSANIIAKTLVDSTNVIDAATYEEFYPDAYSNPIAPTDESMTVTKGENMFNVQFDIAPGVAWVETEKKWVARDVSVRADVLFTIEVTDTEFSTARVLLASGVASPTSSFNLFAFIGPLSTTQIIIIVSVVVFILFTIIYWKIHSWRKKGSYARNIKRYEQHNVLEGIEIPKGLVKGLENKFDRLEPYKDPKPRDKLGKIEKYKDEWNMGYEP